MTKLRQERGLLTDPDRRSFVVLQSVIGTAGPVSAGPIASVRVLDGCRDLVELFAGVSDGRMDRGRDHPVVAVLALTAAAVVAGMKGYTAITGWVADVPAGGADEPGRVHRTKVRTRSGPRIMAALRNLAIGALRLAGRADITEATRWAGRNMDRPFTVLGLTS